MFENEINDVKFMIESNKMVKSSMEMLESQRQYVGNMSYEQIIEMLDIAMDLVKIQDMRINKLEKMCVSTLNKTMDSVIENKMNNYTSYTMVESKLKNEN